MTNCITGCVAKAGKKGYLKYILTKQADGLYVQITDNTESGNYYREPYRLSCLLRGEYPNGTGGTNNEAFFRVIVEDLGLDASPE